MSAVSRVDLLRQEMAEVYDRLCLRLDGLSQDEYFWEPVPGCRTIHPDDRGVWVADYDEPDPVPPPFTTIGWRLVHLADCKVMYHKWASATDVRLREGGRLAHFLDHDRPRRPSRRGDWMPS